MRAEPEPQHTHRFCWCGRRLRAGELCAESYDGHKDDRHAREAEADARFHESIPVE